MPGVRERSFLIAVAPGGDSAGQGSIAVVKSVMVGAPLWFRTEMPLTGETRFITTSLQRFGKRHRIPRQSPLVGRCGDPEPTPVTPGQQTGTGRAAYRGDVVLRELEVIGCQLIQVRSWSVAPVKADIGPAQIVRDDEHNVRDVSKSLRGEKQEQATENHALAHKNESPTGLNRVSKWLIASDGKGLLPGHADRLQRLGGRLYLSLRRRVAVRHRLKGFRRLPHASR